jgi:DNA-binding MarR family transcriptional regulator
MYRRSMADERENLAEAMLGASRALLGIAMRGVDAVASEVTLAQHRVLLLLTDHAELTVTDVARLLDVNQSNASRHAARLAELGLVIRGKVQHDARAVALRLTASGRELVEAVREARLSQIRSVLSRMDLADATRTVEALRSFASAADAVRREEPAPAL